MDENLIKEEICSLWIPCDTLNEASTIGQERHLCNRIMYERETLTEELCKKFIKLSIFHLLVLVHLGDNGSVVNTGGEKG